VKNEGHANSEWDQIDVLRHQNPIKLWEIEDELNEIHLNVLFVYAGAEFHDLARKWEVAPEVSRQLVQRQRQEIAPEHLIALAEANGVNVRSKAFFDEAFTAETNTSDNTAKNTIASNVCEEWIRRLHHAQDGFSAYSTEKLRDFSFEDRQALGVNLRVMEKEVRWGIARELGQRKDKIRGEFYANGADSLVPAMLSEEEAKLEEKLIAEARKAKPLKEAVKQWMPLTPEDGKVWDEIEASEPFARCLARGITQAAMTDIYISGTNSNCIGGAKETSADLAEGMRMVLQDFRHDWEAKNTARVKQTIVTFMDMMDPSKLKASKALHSLCAYRKYGLRLVHRMSQEELLGDLFHEESRDSSAIKGMCLYATAKHLACKVVGGEYRYEKLNTDSTLKKHQAYQKAVLKGAGKGDLVRRTLDRWMGAFTDAKKRRYEDSVEWSKKEKQSLEAYFSKKPSLDTGEGVLFTYYPTKNGEGVIGGHAVDVFGLGKESSPSYFDINLGEYNYVGNNFGRDVQSIIHNEVRLRCERGGIEANGIEM